MKKVNTTLINARQREKEDIVRLGTQLAQYEANGITIESAIADARRELELSEDAIFLLEAENAMKDLNKDTQNFVAFTNAINKAEESGIVSAEELEPLKKVQLGLQENIIARYSLEGEDELYEEES
jgi:hypothetical protein|tara:strand:+ start:489 stop:866 length:378 start_codon:yes stop_codon:yes gene_type:complete